jgi:hypothetical protein
VGLIPITRSIDNQQLAQLCRKSAGKCVVVQTFYSTFYSNKRISPQAMFRGRPLDNAERMK